MSGAPERLVAFVDGIGMTSPEIRQRRITKGQELAALVRALLSNQAVSSRDCRLPRRPHMDRRPLGKIIAAVNRGHQVLDSIH